MKKNIIAFLVLLLVVISIWGISEEKVSENKVYTDSGKGIIEFSIENVNIQIFLLATDDIKFPLKRYPQIWEKFLKYSHRWHRIQVAKGADILHPLVNYKPIWVGSAFGTYAYKSLCWNRPILYFILKNNSKEKIIFPIYQTGVVIDNVSHQFTLFSPNQISFETSIIETLFPSEVIHSNVIAEGIVAINTTYLKLPISLYFHPPGIANSQLTNNKIECKFINFMKKSK